jgi:thymidylate synthase
MNSLDKQYQDLLQTIMDFGVEKKDRTGTGIKSIFGYTIRHSMKEGFPLLTTKKMHWKSVVTELIWFLRGDTNIKFLVDNDCNIWNGDAYKKYEHHFAGWEDTPSIETFANEIKINPGFAKRWGELGPIYGRQWRHWGEWSTIEIPKKILKPGIDQILNLISELKTNPDSRRLMVNAWNVGELDQMVLPPCHYGFQVYTRELSETDRLKKINLVVKYQGNNCKIIDCHNTNSELLILETLEGERIIYEDQLDEPIDYSKFPTRAISLMWNQRSVDTFLGLPFNIASYGLLLEILAKEVNMVPDQLIGNLGDVHLYLNHIEQAKEQIGRDLTCDERVDMASTDIHFDPFDFGVGLNVSDESIHSVCDLYGVPRRTRQPFPLPILRMPDYSTFEGKFVPEYWLPQDFEIENYQSHPAIKAPLSN